MPDPHGDYYNPGSSRTRAERLARQRLVWQRNAERVEQNPWVRPPTIRTITPQQYNANPDRYDIYTPQTAYAYNQGRSQGTLSRDFNPESLVKAPQEYIDTALAQPPVQYYDLDENARTVLSQIQLQNPWYNSTMYRTDVDNLMRNGQGMSLGGNQLSPEAANIAGSQIEAIMAAIANNETGGYDDPYGIINWDDPGGGAWGKYQILASNIPSWTAQALGRTLTPQQFLNDPQAQDQTARYMMQKYLNDYGSPQAVAEAWNAGPGNVGRGVVPEYVNKFNDFLNSYSIQTPNNAWVSPISGAEIGDQQFGWRTHPVTGQEHYHGGIDLAAGTGTPIYAATGGRVIYAGYDGAWGNTYLIADPTGQYTIRYAHADELLYGAGTEIAPGQVIGYVGDTGYSTGPHLHFEVTNANGEYIDPRGLF